MSRICSKYCCGIPFRLATSPISVTSLMVYGQSYLRLQRVFTFTGYFRAKLTILYTHYLHKAE